MDYEKYKQTYEKNRQEKDAIQMAKKKKKKPKFRSKEAKRKYEAWKHMHVPGCAK